MNEITTEQLESALEQAQMINDLAEANMLLKELDAYFDFSEPFEADSPMTFTDPSGINELAARIYAYLANK